MIDNTFFATMQIDKNYQQEIDKKKLKESTDAFEAFLIKKVLDISLKHEDPLFGKDSANKIYNSMYNDAISQALSGGFGFSKLLFDFLTQKTQKP